MPLASINLEKWIGALNSLLTEQAEQRAVEREPQAAKGNWPAALDRLTDVRRIPLRASPYMPGIRTYKLCCDGQSHESLWCIEPYRMCRARASRQLDQYVRNRTTTQTSIDREPLKQTLKEALPETLHEERQRLHEVFAEVLEDFALGETIREGLQTPPATRGDVLDAIEGRA